MSDTKSGANRHRNVLRNNIQGVTKPSIRRLARRGGVKRVSGLVYEETRNVLNNFLEQVIRDAVIYTEHALHKKTVKTMDVVRALKRNGYTLYGYDHDRHRGRKGLATKPQAPESKSIDRKDAEGPTLLSIIKTIDIETLKKIFKKSFDSAHRNIDYIKKFCGEKKWLNDVVVNFCIELMLESKSDRYFAAKIDVLDPVTYSHGKPKNKELDMKALAEQNYTVPEKDYVVFPLNQNSNHWILVILSLLKKRAIILDSCTSMNSRQPDISMLQKAFSFAPKGVKYEILRTGMEFSQDNVCYVNVPQQPNSYDCGIFMLCCLDCFGRNPESVFEAGCENSFDARFATEVRTSLRAVLTKLISQTINK